MDILVFDTWKPEAKVADEGLQRYVTTAPVFRSKTGARYGSKRFYKSKIFVVERFMNKLMNSGHRGRSHKISSGHNTGKASKARTIAVEAFTLIEKKTKKNPFSVFIQAVENAAPREEIITIEYGGARYPKAVDCAPQRRVDIALKNLVVGAGDKSFNKKKGIAAALADEIIAASDLRPESFAVTKKNDVERQADSSR